MKVLVGNTNHANPKAFEEHKRQAALANERKAQLYIGLAAIELDLEKELT